MKVLILSDERDKTCDVVCSYLYRLQVPFILFNYVFFSQYNPKLV